jgi:lysophospholipase L1-like esterase
MKTYWVPLVLLGLFGLQAGGRAAEQPKWVAPMKKVHARFKGTKGTFAQFGDSITVTMAFWAPLAYQPKNLDQAAAYDLALVKKTMKAECWRGWKGPEYGSNGSMTIRWADENVDRWLKKLNPEAVLIMFGTNDLNQVPIKEYEEKMRSVVRRCLDNGSVVILTTIPPRSGLMVKSCEYAYVARKIAQEETLPLVDYFGEVLKRRPDDWDGAMAKFKDVPGDAYNVPTLIARDGVHPSNPPGDYSQESLNKNGYALRNYLTLRAYAAVIRHVLEPEKPMTEELKKAVTFYASFDRELKADFAGGERDPWTRLGQLDKKNFTYEKGYPEKAFRIAAGKGISGGALECVDVLPGNGRIYFPAKGNLAFKKGGWGGTVSFWLKGDPNTMLKTGFCDPVQLTQKGANNGGIWCDFNDAKPRDFRMGVFPAVAEGVKPIAENDPKAPIVKTKSTVFKADEWHHVALSWNNLDTGKKDAQTVLYVDGKSIGEMKDIELAMNWEIEKTGIYIGVNFIGLLDEFALFNRALTEAEVKALKEQPALLTGLKN